MKKISGADQKPLASKDASPEPLGKFQIWQISSLDKGDFFLLGR